MASFVACFRPIVRPFRPFVYGTNHVKSHMSPSQDGCFVILRTHRKAFPSLSKRTFIGVHAIVRLNTPVYLDSLPRRYACFQPNAADIVLVFLKTCGLLVQEAVQMQLNMETNTLPPVNSASPFGWEVGMLVKLGWPHGQELKTDLL